MAQEIQQWDKQKTYMFNRIGRQDTDLQRTQTGESISSTHRIVTQVPLIKNINAIKSKKIFPQLNLCEIGFNDNSYFINSNANVASYKSNLLRFSKRCPSPEERLQKVLYDNLEVKYTRRKSCKGGIIFGEVSQQNIQREKQFPLQIINMQMKKIILEATKKRKEKEKQQIKQKQRNLLHAIPKQASFKNATAKSLFNSQLPLPTITSPVYASSNLSNFTQSINSPSLLATQNTQNLKTMNTSSLKSQDLTSQEENKKFNPYQNNQNYSSSSPINIEKNNSSKVDPSFQQQQNTQVNKVQLQQQNQNVKISISNSGTNVEQLDQSKQPSDQDDLKDENKITPINSLYFKTLQVNSIEKVQFDEGIEPYSCSKLDLKSINSIKMEIDERKKTDIYENEIEEQLTDKHLKDKPPQQITNSFTKYKQSDKDSISSFSQSDEDDDVDENQDIDAERKSNSSPTKLIKDKRNVMVQKQEYQRKSTLQKSEIHNNDFDSPKNLQQVNFSLPPSAIQNHYLRNIPRFSVVNVVAPPLSQEMHRKSYMIMSKPSPNQTSLTNLSVDNFSKLENSLQTKQTMMLKNIKQIQENQDLQEIVQEYLAPGSTEINKYSPENPEKRIMNMKRVFKTATNLIALQNRVKANNTFFRNYYNIIGKVCVDNGVQYLSQMAEEILSTPSSRKATVFCAPKKRKVYIHNSTEDQIKMVTAFSSKRLNQSVQKYVGDKQSPSQSDGFSQLSKFGMSSTQSKFYQTDYFSNQSDISKISSPNRNVPEKSKYFNIDTNAKQNGQSFHKINDLSKSVKKQKFDSCNNSEIQQFIKQGGNGNNGDNLSNQQNSFLRKQDSSRMLYNINNYFGPNFESKSQGSPYLMPCTPKSASHSKSRDFQLNPLPPAQAQKKKQPETQRNFLNSLNKSPIYHNIQNAMQKTISKNSTHN